MKKKDKLPCELIQDLFPSYIDGLTSEITNQVVEEHIEDCVECKHILMGMKEKLSEPINQEEKEEIDFLKKTRNHAYKVIVGSVFVVILLIVGIYVSKTYLIGKPIYGDGVEFRKLEVQNTNCLGIDVVPKDENIVISSIQYTEEDGVVQIHLKWVKPSIFFKAGGTAGKPFYIAQEEIKRVCIGERILWERGEKITEFTSKVYNTRHLYVGDMSANGATARALNIGDVLGGGKNELQTTKEPYGWNILLDEGISSLERTAKERIMRAYAYIILAVVDNLGEMSFEYKVNGESCRVVVTKEDATKFAGMDIKEYGKDILLLQELIEKAKVYGRLYSIQLND